MDLVFQAAGRSRFGVREPEAGALKDMDAIVKSIAMAHHDQNILNVEGAWLSNMNLETSVDRLLAGLAPCF